MPELKISTWNCNSSPSIKTEEKAAQVFQTKSNFLNELNADVSVIQEISKPSQSETNNVIWSGDSLGRGIAVRTKQNYSIEKVNDFPANRSTLPVRILGEVDFNLLVIWSRPLKTGLRDYVNEVIAQIETFKSFLNSGPSVVAGDFNSNAIWNKHSKNSNHSHLVYMLENQLGLKSCYHSHFNLQHGEETHPTIYWMRHLDKSFHIDYCFAPKEWKIKSVEVGTHENWLKKSDHCPLTVDFQIN